MSEPTEAHIVCQLDMTRAEAWALAQLCKRLTYSDAESLCGPDERPEDMITSTDKLRIALAENGYVVR